MAAARWRTVPCATVPSCCFFLLDLDLFSPLGGRSPISRPIWTCHFRARGQRAVIYDVYSDTRTIIYAMTSTRQHLATQHLASPKLRLALPTDSTPTLANERTFQSLDSLPDNAVLECLVVYRDGFPSPSTTPNISPR